MKKGYYWLKKLPGCCWHKTRCTVFVGLISKIDSLTILLKKEPESKYIIKQLAERYLEAKNKNKTNEQLNKYIRLSSDTLQIKSLKEIIKLTESEDFTKALNHLRKLK